MAADQSPADRLKQIRERLDAATPGHVEKPVLGGNVMLCHMDPAARDLLDRAIEEWGEQTRISAERELPPPQDPVYAFAYWLFRYSGLLNAAAPSDVAWLLGEVERMEHERQAIIDRLCALRGERVDLCLGLGDLYTALLNGTLEPRND